MNLRLIVLMSLIGIFMTIACWGQNSPSLFPLCRSMAGDRELPYPYGVGFTYHHQTQDYDLANLTVNLPGVDLAQASAVVEVDNRTDEENLKFDLWLLPFLNVFGIVGYVEGETEVTLPPPLNNLKVDYDGLVYGGGFTLAAGTERFFGSVTTIFTETDLDVSTSSVQAFIVTPRAGYRVGFGEIWIGGMYQHTEEEHRGSVTIPQMGTVDYDVKLEEKDPWNYLAGMKIDLGKKWDLELEGGVGERKHVTASLTYRF